jgi:hypothetical protein
MTKMCWSKVGVLSLCGAVGLLAGATTSCSSSTGASSGTGGKGGGAGQTGAGGGGGATSLYAKYGGAPTVAKVVDDAVAGLLADCEEAPYFAVVGTAGHDSVARLKSCLRLQFTAVLGGPASYPGVNDEGDTCDDMTTAHADLGIPGPVFDKFVADLGAVLTADGVSAADVTTIAGQVSGLKTQIVSAAPVDKSACGGASGAAGAGGAGGISGAAGAGGAGGATTLYAKYGGAPTVAKVVDDAVAGLLADCAEAPYFAVVGTAGHDSVARLKSCLRLQFTALLGGPASYPGVDDEGDTCEDMTTAHADLGIPGPVFDKFVADLGAVLAADGVSSGDVTTIAGQVSGLKPQVVSANPTQKSACDAGVGQ